MEQFFEILLFEMITNEGSLWILCPAKTSSPHSVISLLSLVHEYTNLHTLFLISFEWYFIDFFWENYRIILIWKCPTYDSQIILALHLDYVSPTNHGFIRIMFSDSDIYWFYIQEQAKVADFKGYTGKPIYSVWYGSESEQRAVFVDEVKCVGCLKCALIAEKSFAIESVYGRARVIAQWADSETKINEAIEACPVNCIS